MEVGGGRKKRKKWFGLVWFEKRCWGKKVVELGRGLEGLEGGL